MVLIKNSLLNMITREIPSMLSYKIHIDKDSSFNTPPVFAIYCVLLNLRLIKKDGLDIIGKNNKLKSELIYNEIDNNKCFSGFSNFDDRSERQKKLWQKDTFEAGLPFVDFESMCNDVSSKLDMLRLIRDVGFVVLENVPTKEGQVLKVISELGYTRETNYGALFEVRTEVNPNNLAYTNMGLGSHTDNPYRDPVPTVQLLHCLESSTEGGDSVLVDGFKAAAVLRQESKEDFDILTSTWINFRFSDTKTDLRSRVPMIELNDNSEIVKVRYNNRSIDTINLPTNKIRSFYKAYRHWSEIIERDNLKVIFKLSEGDLMLLDNTRIMHARTAFSKKGKRHLQGAYTDLDGLYSQLNVLENRQQNG